MSPQNLERRLAAILSADAVGYSAHMARDEEATVAAIRAAREEIAGLVEAHGGRVVDAPGDNLLAELRSATDAVSCALEIQRAREGAATASQSAEPLRFRVGVHAGEVLVEGGRLYGDGVNVAARLEALAPAGGICVSASVRDQVSPRLELDFEDLGEQHLKNIPRAVRVFRLETPPLSRMRPASEGERPSIVVLPFTNLSGDPEQEYFSDGITEDLITDLAKTGGLSIIARTSAFFYKGKSLPLARIGSDLGAQFVVEGSVRRAGDRIRVTAQLVEVASGHHLWAERYDRDLADIFAVQDELVREIVGELTAGLDARTRGRAPGGSPRRAEAHDHLLRARSFRRQYTPETIAAIRAELDRTLELDPECAEAWALLADTWGAEWIFGWNPEASVEKVEELGHRAIALDPAGASPHWVLGMAYLHSGRLSEALVEARTTIALDPELADGLHLLALVLGAMGRLEEALESLDRSLRLDPRRWEPYAQRGAILLSLGRDEEAVEVLEKGVEMFPHHQLGRLLLLTAYHRTERPADARRIAKALSAEVRQLKARLPFPGGEPFRAELDAVLALYGPG